jgi:hypothetical protein
MSEDRRTLAEDFAFALRTVRNLDDRNERFSAYAREAIQTGEYSRTEIEAADIFAHSIELARRVR